MMKSKEIVSYLDSIISNPRCELEYNKDYELLIATMLSAQTTDKRVNMVTKVLFDKYHNLKELSEASLDDLIEIVLTAIDNLTGNKLDYGMGQLARKLTQNVKNEKIRKTLQTLIQALLFLAICAVLLIVVFVIEAWRMGKI